MRRSDRPGGWGGFGLVSATVDALAVIQRDLDPDWVVLLSGQDYPARPVAQVAQRLGESGADVHLTILHRVSDEDHDEPLRWWHARYFYRWWTLPRVPVAVPAGVRQRRINAEYEFSMAQRRLFIWTLPRASGIRIGVRRRRSPFSNTYPCWSAQQWIAVSRRGLRALASEFAARPELVRLYRSSVIPDESMIQTMLINAPGIVAAQPNLTYQRYAGVGDAHAADLSLDDLGAVLASGRPFARKMHPQVSAELMDALDDRLGYPRWTPPRS